MDFEEIGRRVSGDLGYTVHLERGQVRLADKEEPVPMALRATQIYQREGEAWKLVHRHADPIAAIRAPESVIER